MGEGILVLDQSRRVMLANNQLQQLLDLPPDITAEGASFAEVVKQLEHDGETKLSDDQDMLRLMNSERFETG